MKGQRVSRSALLGSCRKILRHFSRDNICIIDLVYVDTWVENSEDG